MLRLHTYLLRSQRPLWALLVLFGGLELWSIWQNVQATRLASHVQQQVLQGQRLLNTVIDLETGLRGYALTGEPDFLEPYNEARAHFQSELDELGRLLTGEGDAENAQRVEHIGQAVGRWFLDIADYEVDRRPTHPEEVVAREKSGRGKQLIDQVRSEAAAFEAAKTRELQRLQRRAALASVTGEAVSLLGVLGAVLASVFSAVYVARQLSRKFGRLADAAEHLAATERARPVGGFALVEAARLADSFNTMASKLERSHERLTAHNRQLNVQNADALAVNELAGQLQTCFTLDEGYRVLGAALPQLFPEVQGALAVMNASRNLMEVKVEWGGEVPGEGIFAPHACWAIRSGRPHDPEGQLLAAPCAAHSAFGPHLCLPLIAHGEALGTLRLSALPGAQEERLRLRKLAVTVASQVGLGVSNLRLRETLRGQSIRDPLTGLFNRRYLDETFEREIRRAERYGRPVTVLMLDVDHFKRFNDTYGHDAGDAVLMALGRLLQEHFRREDIVCRYGGEEFAVLLSEAAYADGLQRAEALRTAMSLLKVEHQGRDLGQLTVSVGLSSFPEHGAESGQLIQLADRALYRAKQAGRNQVQSAAD